MTPAHQRKAVALARSAAAKKGWETRREKAALAEAEKRRRAALEFQEATEASRHDFEKLRDLIVEEAAARQRYIDRAEDRRAASRKGWETRRRNREVSEIGKAFANSPIVTTSFVRDGQIEAMGFGLGQELERELQCVRRAFDGLPLTTTPSLWSRLKHGLWRVMGWLR